MGDPTRSSWSCFSIFEWRPPWIRHPIQEKLGQITVQHCNFVIMKLRVVSQAGYDTHVYFIPAHHLKPEIIDRNGYWVQVGHCTVHVGPLAGTGLHAVTLRCPRGTRSSERRQGLRAVAREEVLPLVHPRVLGMLELVKTPQEGPVPLMSLSQLYRECSTDWYEIYEGRARRILNPRLLREMEAVTARVDDNKDVRVEHLRSGPCCGKEHRFAQFGAFATRVCCLCLLLSWGLNRFSGRGNERLGAERV